MENKEDWRDIENFNGWQISSLGRVRHIKIMAPLNDEGVLAISIRRKPHRKTFRIKRLVADYFLDGHETPTHLITHINGDKTDCSAENLDFLPGL